MYQRGRHIPIIHFLDLAEQILAADETVIVPVKKLWLRVRHESPMPVPPLEQFTDLLRSDRRFQILLESNEPHRNDVPPEWTPKQIAVHEQIMEELGFFRGPRVKLVRVELNPDLLRLMFSRPLESLTEIVKGTWELRPANGALEPQLREIWEKVQELKRTIGRVLTPKPQSGDQGSEDVKF